jgi:pimeloyl-ACP methyl ester carboxylesterase
LALQWFGGPSQSPGICEIPLETFIDATDLLTSRGCNRIIVVGTSKGAEAALLASTIDQRIKAVVAISPTSVVWGNIGEGVDGIAWPERSSWSLKGTPLDFIPSDLSWQKNYRDGLISYRSFFEKCLANDVQTNERARIPVELSVAELILVAGGDDALWPSDDFAREIVQSRQAHRKSATLIFDQDAGHRILFPGESTRRSSLHSHGGTDEADAELGVRAWRIIEQLL